MIVFWIIGIVFLSLIILVPLIERFGPRMSSESLGKLSRYFLPLIALLLVLQILNHIF